MFIAVWLCVVLPMGSPTFSFGQLSTERELAGQSSSEK